MKKKKDMEKHSIKNILTWNCMFWHFARDRCSILFLNHRLTIVEKKYNKDDKRDMISSNHT